MLAVPGLARQRQRQSGAARVWRSDHSAARWDMARDVHTVQELNRILHERLIQEDTSQLPLAG
jgi:hypothetical protein